MLPNPYVILGAVAFFLVSISGTYFLAYTSGKDDMQAHYTAQELARANAALKISQEQANRAADAGVQHDAQAQVVRNTTREIIRTVTIPPDADPYLPVGFVRLFDRSASRSISGDPYPGKSDGDPSDVRVSEAATLLARGWADEFYRCRKQVEDTAALKPVLPSPPPPERGFFERLGL